MTGQLSQSMQIWRARDSINACLRQLRQNLLLHLLNSLWLQFARSARDQSNRWIITFTASPAWAWPTPRLRWTSPTADIAQTYWPACSGPCPQYGLRPIQGGASCRAAKPNGRPIPRFTFPRTVSAPLLTSRSSYPLARRMGMTPCPSRPRRGRIGRDRCPIILTARGLQTSKRSSWGFCLRLYRSWSLPGVLQKSLSGVSLTAHTSYSRASNDQAAKAAMSVHERMDCYSGNLALATQRERAGIYSSIQTQTTPFQWRGAVSNIASKCPGSETRDRLSARERSSRASPTKRAGECFLATISWYPRGMGGLRPILDLRPINRALCKRPFRMITLKQILGQIRPGDWFASVDLKDAYFHIQIAPHHRRFLRFAFEGTAYQYSVLPFGLAQGERDTYPQLSGRLADFSSVPGHATQPHRLAAYSLGVPRAMCKHAKEHPRPESVHNISGSLHGLPGNESLPLVGTHGSHFVLPAPFQRRQLCSFEEISEAAGTHGVSFGSMSSGLITHAPVAAMA